MKNFLVLLGLAVLLMWPIPSLAQGETPPALVPPDETAPPTEAEGVLPAQEAVTATLPPATAIPAQAATATPAPAAISPPALEVSAALFPWYDPVTKEVNWAVGLIHFLLGAIGALVMVYLFLGEFLPSMGGRADYVKDDFELRQHKKMRQDILLARIEQAERIRTREVSGEKQLQTVELQQQERLRLDVADKLGDDLNEIVEFLERRVDRNRWRLFLLGFPMYILLGGFFAAALALNMMQALLIGFSWTAIVERFGLARQQEEVKRIRAQEIAELEQRAEEAVELKKKNESLKQDNEVLRAGMEELKSLYKK